MINPSWCAKRAIQFLIVVVFITIGKAEEVKNGWRIEEANYRIKLDTDANRQKAGDILEVGIDLKKIGEKLGLSAGPENIAIIAEQKGGSFSRLPFSARREVADLSGYTNTLFRFVSPANTEEIWAYLAKNKLTNDENDTLYSKNILEGALQSVDAWKKSPDALSLVVQKSSTGSEGLLFSIDKDQIEKLPANENQAYSFSRSFPVSSEFRGKSGTIAFDFQSECKGYLPLSISVQQYNEAGARILEDVVERRWLTINLANGQPVRMREKAWIFSDAASIKLTFSLRPRQKKETILTSSGWKSYEKEDDLCKLSIGKIELLTGERISFPGRNPALYSNGVTEDKKDHSLVVSEERAFFFNALPRLTFGSGERVQQADAYHWPLKRGTFEYWFQIDSTASLPSQIYLVNAWSGASAKKPGLDIIYKPDEKMIQVQHAEPLTGKMMKKEGKVSLERGAWHHLAYCWDSTSALRELFVDGKKVLTSNDPFLGVEEKADRIDEAAISRVWIGANNSISWGNKNVLTGKLTEIRLSNEIRYSGDFTPEPRFASDEHTTALFHFNLDKNGVHGASSEPLLGGLYTKESPIDRMVRVEVKGATAQTIEWFPAVVDQSNDSQCIFPIRSYPELKKEELEASYVPKEKEFILKGGSSEVLACGNDPVMDWVEISPESETPLVAPFLSKEGEIDPRTMESIVSGMKLGELKTDREKADAIFRFLVKNTNYYTTTYDIQPMGRAVEPVYSFPILDLNGYLQFQCANLNGLAKTFFLMGGLSSNEMPGSAHTFEQVYFNDSWHLYDLMPRLFFSSRDNSRSAAHAEISEDPYLVLGGKSTGSINYYMSSTLREPAFGQRQISFDTMEYRLNPGESFTYYWQNAGCYNPLMTQATRSAKLPDYKSFGLDLLKSNYIPPYISNGVFKYKGKPAQANLAFTEWTNEACVYSFYSPYPICSAYFQVEGAGSGKIPVEFSDNFGKSWKTLESVDGSPTISFEQQVYGKHAYQLRFKCDPNSIKLLEHAAIVQMNPNLLTPVLGKGENKLVMKAASGSAKVKVHYRERDQSFPLDGTVTFGAFHGDEKMLLVGRPGETIAFQVTSTQKPQVTVPEGITASIENIVNGAWPVKLAIASNCPDALHPISVQVGNGIRKGAVLVSPHVDLQTGAKLKEGSTVPDPMKIYDQTFKIGDGNHIFSTAPYPEGDYFVYVFARNEPEKGATVNLTTAKGKVPLITSHFTYCEYLFQDEFIKKMWRWYVPVAEANPYPTPKTVHLKAGNSIELQHQGGTTWIQSIVLLPATNEKLVESVQDYLFTKNYFPWNFEHTWNPITLGVPYLSE
ncbi:MAG: LamG-like jellyroll fold domain-containing protein [Verrucomicrobiota bacterium]